MFVTRWPNDLDRLKESKPAAISRRRRSLAIPQIMRTGRKRMRKRGGQPGNQNAVTHGRHSAPVRAARLAALKERQAAWKEKQRLSDEWIKTDYAAIALAGKLARRR